MQGNYRYSAAINIVQDEPRGNSVQDEDTLMPQ